MEKKKVVPERTDSFFMKEVMQMAFNARIGMILMTVVVLFLIMLVYSFGNRSIQTVVIDGNTGKTYAPIRQSQNVAQELIDRQIVYYTGQVCENYFNRDHKTITLARQVILELAGTQFRTTLGDAFLDDADVQRSIADKTQSFIQWELHPRVTMRNDPYYTAFATLQRTIKANGLTKEIKKFNVRVDWGRLHNNMDYVKRPHSLVLLDIKILNEGSVELNEQINRMQ